ncbi:MAG: MarR family winged helix-turn-helix transcriptional regulator [Acinetobacter sp.]
MDNSALPEVGEGKRGEDGYLGYLLRQAANAYRYRVEQALSDLQLTQPQFAVMTMLGAYPGHSSADLARLALLTPQTMSVIVTNLVKMGLVNRRAHQVHGRIQKLELTNQGKDLLQAAKTRVYGLENAMLAVLSKDDEAVIKKWLVKVAANSYKAPDV